LPPETVHGDNDVDVIDELGQTRRLCGADLRRRKVVDHAIRHQDGIERGAGPVCCPTRDHIGHRFEGAAVVRHESNFAAKLGDLDDSGPGQERCEGIHMQHDASTMAPMLVWMDLEMTGLDHTSDVIVEIATLLTDDNLEIIAEGPDLVVHQPDEVLARMDPFVVEMHTRSGLLESIKSSDITLEQAGAATLDFIKLHVPETMTVPLCGNSIGTDRRFLAAYLPDIENYLHYRSIDVSSVKELVKRWYPGVDESRPRGQGSHRALDDIRESIREMVFYRDNVFVDPATVADGVPGVDDETDADGVPADVTG
jgi:oligoribonuclease